MKAQVILFPLFVFLFVPIAGMAQMVSVSGYVKNQTTGEVKKNVTIFESNSGIGTISNNEGYYRLLLNPGKLKLEFSSPGFSNVTSAFVMKADTTISVELVPLASPSDKTEGGHEQQKDDVSPVLTKLVRKTTD
jgi:hypothetical protein